MVTWLVRREAGGWPNGHALSLTFHQWVTVFSAGIAYAGNAGAMALGLGSGGHVALTWSADASVGGFSIAPHHTYAPSLDWLTQAPYLAAGAWSAVALAPLMLVFVAVMITRRQPRSTSTRALHLGLWVLSLLAFIPILRVLANLSVSAHGDVTGHLFSFLNGSGQAQGSAWAGLPLWPTTALVIAYAALVGLVVLAAGARRKRSPHGPFSD